MTDEDDNDDNDDDDDGDDDDDDEGCDLVIWRVKLASHILDNNHEVQLKFLIGSANSPITTVRLHASVQLGIYLGDYRPRKFVACWQALRCAGNMPVGSLM